MTKIQKRLLSGLAELELNPQNLSTRASALRLSAAKVDVALEISRGQLKNYFPNSAGDCPVSYGDNIKVNQNCLNLSDPDLQGRGQANNETFLAQDPNHPDHLVGSANDYRRGDGTCGISYSTDNGRSWTDATTPNGFTRGQPTFGKAREYWQAAGDTSVAWDTKGNAYLSCQVFNRGLSTSPNPDQSSGFYVFRSTQNNGASWNFPGRAVTAFSDTVGLGTTLEDKQLMTVDNHVGSRFQDRVYVTWTEFAADGSAYIWEAYSADYGETFSNRVLVSKNSPLCVNNYGLGTPQGNCNENQFSQPFTAPDGTLYVVWANFNNATGHPIGDDDGGGGGGDSANKAAADPNDNHNQILIAKSTDGGQTFGDPVKVADYYDLPDCAEYQQGNDEGRACVPEKGTTANSIFRATNYPVGSVNPKKPRQVVVTFGSYINAYSNESNGCAPAGLSADGLNLFTGVKTVGACNNDILVSVSNNGGASFTGTDTDVRELTSATPARNQRTSDQWFQWATFTKSGRFAVSYYDRQYGDDEITGYSDFSLSGSDDLVSFGTARVTSKSSPPPTEFSGLFWGDYTGLTAIDNQAHPAWSDTRPLDVFLCPGTGAPGVPPAICTGTAPNAPLANDQDFFTAIVNIPSH
jgi:hypothetical protein